MPYLSNGRKIALLVATTIILLLSVAEALPMESGTPTEEQVGWVSENHSRGTATLLYSCLFTMFICTWNALHLNVEVLSDNYSLRPVIIRKLSGVVLGLLAPEAIAMLAIKEALEVRQLCRTIAPRSKTPFTVTHAMFTLMGGFAVQMPGSERFTIRPGFLATGDVELPDIPAQDIQDKSKADWVTKSLACLQIGWFIAQIIAVQRLPITTLEIFTITIIICTTATFTAWWHKPFDVSRQMCIKIDPSNENWAEKLTSLRACEEEKPLRNLLNIWHLGTVFREVLSSDRRTNSSSLQLFNLAYICITLTFGGCHLIAWNFSFPSDIERLMWRITSIACMILPLSILAVYYIMHWYVGNVFDGSNPAFRLDAHVIYELFKPVYILITGMYLLARLYLLLEVFLSLRSVPAGVYQKGNWSQYIPHF